MIVSKQIEDKVIVWLSTTNQYIVVEPLVAEILELLEARKPETEIVTFLTEHINIPSEEALSFIDDLKKFLVTENSIKKSNSLEYNQKEYEHSIFYQINQVIFKVSYQSDYELSLIHPKFAHLTITPQDSFDFSYKVYTENNSIHFFINQGFIGVWNLEESHYFQGKFSMKVIEHTHKFEEDKWMGIFHASAVSDGETAILFLGDSGNGKSTSLALLQASGFTCLADDFVPIHASSQFVHSFPSAISIKKNSVPILLPLYPELENKAEYHFQKLNKIVRYLPPNNSNYESYAPCKKLVFIKYVPESDLVIEKISKIDAFQQLVPDSWLSPLKENAHSFLEWFNHSTCYQLIYSDNTKMIHTAQQLFSDEL